MVESREKICLVAGGAGFLGSHMCDKLIEEGQRVLCLDNMSTGSTDNISHLLDHPRFSWIAHDIIEPLPFIGKVDAIYNFACPASPPRYQKDPIHTWKTNILGTLHLLELAHLNDALFFQASTSEVYGDPLIHPQKESYWGHVNPIGIRSCYDEGKRAAETIAFDFHRMLGVKIKIARIFNTYGPRMSCEDGRVISNFIFQALQNRPLTIYGKGEQTRSLCYVSDLIDGIQKLMESPLEVLGPINFGNPIELSIQEIAHNVLQLCQSSSQMHYFPLPSDDPQKRKPDIEQARQILDWNPQVSLEQGLLSTIQYFKDALKISDISK